MDKKVNKQAVIDEYLFGGGSYRQLSRKYGVPRATLHDWIQDFTGIIPVKRNSDTLAIIMPEPTEHLPKEVVELQKQLAQEKLHNKLLTAMIEIAETELKIPIRKKYGPRQLKK